MKIKINPRENTITFETQTMPAFCSLCGWMIGSFEIIKGSEFGSILFMNPICNECFRKHDLKKINPHLGT